MLLKSFIDYKQQTLKSALSNRSIRVLQISLSQTTPQIQTKAEIPEIVFPRYCQACPSYSEHRGLKSKNLNTMSVSSWVMCFG
mmetsp:Transcript_4647/g.8802  ORF Transcript_4647/g.8802 Transcript_4647/m.8802 type:complete len:83 (-) Transcript_4647:257-505(-)